VGSGARGDRNLTQIATLDDRIGGRPACSNRLAEAHRAAPATNPTANGVVAIVARPMGVPLGPVHAPPIAAPPPIAGQFNDEADGARWRATALVAAGKILILLLIVAIWVVLKLSPGGNTSSHSDPAATSSSSDFTLRPKPAAAASDTPTTDIPTASPESTPIRP
jgi:hypothetical protein